MVRFGLLIRLINGVIVTFVSLYGFSAANGLLVGLIASCETEVLIYPTYYRVSILVGRIV